MLDLWACARAREAEILEDLCLERCGGRRRLDPKVQAGRRPINGLDWDYALLVEPLENGKCNGRGECTDVCAIGF